MHTARLGPTRALPVLGAILALALTGCSNTQQSPSASVGTSSSSSSQTSANASSSGNHDIVIAIPQAQGAALDLEPCDSENGGPLVLRHNVIQSLTDLDPTTLAVTPLLATAWKQTNPTTWTFTLRDGVTFHDGAKFDAAAAVFGINRSLNNTKIACSDTAKVGAGIKLTPTAISTTELQITTNVPDPILDRELSYIDLVSPNTPADKLTDKPIGTGPYTWGTNTIGQSFVINRWDGYWGTKPAVTSAKVIFRPDNSVRAAVVKTGEADIATNIAAQDATGDSQTKVVPLGSVFGYRLPIQSAPFTDIRVRQAVEYAIDKASITKSLLSLTGTPADQLVVSTNNGFVPDYKAPTFDIEKAKSLLAAAKADGVATDTPIDLVGMLAQFPGSDEVEQAVQQNLQQAGFTVKLRIVDAEEWKKLLFKPFPPGQTPTILGFKHDNTSGDASSSFTSYMSTAGCCASLSDPAFDALFTKGLAAAGSERASLFQQAASLEYIAGVTIVPVANLTGLWLVSKRISVTPDILNSKFRFPLEDVTFK
jgi:peptide/nickel transport system substrate-binding protein